jgi:hypothetical protein
VAYDATIDMGESEIGCDSLALPCSMRVESIKGGGLRKGMRRSEIAQTREISPRSKCLRAGGSRQAARGENECSQSKHTTTEMIHDRARAPSRQTRRVALNDVGRESTPTGGQLILFSQTANSTGT